MHGRTDNETVYMTPTSIPGKYWFMVHFCDIHFALKALPQQCFTDSLVPGHTIAARLYFIVTIVQTVDSYITNVYSTFKEMVQILGVGECLVNHLDKLQHIVGLIVSFYHPCIFFEKLQLILNSFDIET